MFKQHPKTIGHAGMLYFIPWVIALISNMIMGDIFIDHVYGEGVVYAAIGAAFYLAFPQLLLFLVAYKLLEKRLSKLAPEKLCWGIILAGFSLGLTATYVLTSALILIS